LLTAHLSLINFFFSHLLDAVAAENLYPSSKLLCVVCKDSFSNPWDLMVHAQAAHMVNIYEIGESDEEEDDANGKSHKSDKTNGESHHNNNNNNINGSCCNGSAMHSENVSPFCCCFCFRKRVGRYFCIKKH